MPELPEVETGRRIAERAIADKTIARVATVDDRIVYDGVAPRTFAAKLRGRRIESICRRGKQLWFALDRGPHPLLHFGMTGRFVVYETKAERPRFWKVEFVMDDGTRLAMPNARRLGRIRLRDDPANEPPIANLGFDPLHETPTARKLADLIAPRKTPIKALLLDQSVFAGVGNWIADEVLYQSRIAPGRRASELDTAEVRRMRTALMRVIDKACAVEADKSRFPKTWLFHRRWTQPDDAMTVKGEPLVFEKIGGRTTAWAPSRQS